MLVEANLELAASVLFFVFLFAGRNYKIVYDLSTAVYRDRAICFIFTRRFVNHGWGTAVCFHLALAMGGLFW